MTVWNMLVGLVTGIVSGCGIGGGSLLMLWLTLAASVPQYTAAGINLSYFLCCAPTALVLHIKNKLVETDGLWMCILAGAVTAALMGLLAAWLPTVWLRRGFGVLLLYIGAKELLAKKNQPVQKRAD